ncbi:M14 family zinc carboxypeptidase [Planotetraspora sp. A-T 1434]|uniref:M14 family metallopeptidase n=1 Tax=Planotetraspora sp. A-T 1434 TaxID=2979219 RepID=UPI0021BE43DB|nr:M14 family zinc carboxypeptidase [Planotetraspora sp. A-T 1434]MCT9933524.1 M14 family zinc carboxypeptidase [Planotetraspora sp. A-T 1434]
MSRRLIMSVLAAGALGAALLTPIAGAQAASGDPLPPSDRSDLYQLDSPPGTAGALLQKGFDVVQQKIAGDKEHIELTATQIDLKKLQGLGLRPQPVRNPQGQTQLQAAKAQAAGGYTVWKSYSEKGGIADQLRAIADANKDVAKLESIGKTVQGKDILAIKLTKLARVLPDGAKPAVLYSATQHAREWIATEVDMRLLKHLVAGKSTPDIGRLLATTEIWFVPVANPDGYDFTFTEGNRLWRKNLRDNDGDGVITRNDGVDPNRNFPTRWRYDEEGSSSVLSSETYRGTAPGSEPETRAMDGLLRRLRFKAQVNYHSYGPLLLYPEGWQVETKTADDPVYLALTGTDEKPAVPGFDPGVGAELYTTNGETTDHAHRQYGTLAWTPELEEGCEGCGFVFPDDEALVQGEFEKQLPFALDVAKSALNPSEPVSHLGNTVPDFVVDKFDVSYGTDQVVQVDAKRKLGPVFLKYQINGGPTKIALTSEWKGGERYGDGYNTYFHQLRGTVTGAKPGDTVKVWFSSITKQSEDFTYKVATDIGGKVLVVAAEDVTGASPAQGVTEAKYADDYARALSEAGYSSDVYDVDANGRKAPHPLGVLSHYKAVIWETGDDTIPRAVGQPGGTAANLAEALELAFRDYLNEGGKLLTTGKYALYAQNVNGAYWYEPDYPAQPECTTRTKPPCLALSNDFAQYYLGAYSFVDGGGQDADGNTLPLKGTGGAFAGFIGTLNGGDSPGNQSHTSTFVSTSSVLTPDKFPQFASAAPLKWQYSAGAPFSPHTGAWDVQSGQADVSWKRLTRTIDLTGKTSGSLSFWTSYDTEPNWDFLTVEAHTAGQDDWTTLPDANGHTSEEPGDSCGGGWASIHPFTAHYQTYDGASSCTATGTTGAWHAASGSSNGWQQWSIDLSPYAGKQVEVSISYISDWGTQGLGVWLDDATIKADGATVSETSFESDLGGWTVAGPPPGSAAAINDWARSDQSLEDGAGITTKDTVYFGFGAEGATTQAMRTDLVKRAMTHLLSTPLP